MGWSCFGGTSTVHGEMKSEGVGDSWYRAVFEGGIECMNRLMVHDWHQIRIIQNHPTSKFVMGERAHPISPHSDKVRSIAYMLAQPLVSSSINSTSMTQMSNDR